MAKRIAYECAAQTEQGAGVEEVEEGARGVATAAAGAAATGGQLSRSKTTK